MKTKDWLELIGLGGLTIAGGLFGIIALGILSILVTAGPIIVVIWVVWKLFFN